MNVRDLVQGIEEGTKKPNHNLLRISNDLESISYELGRLNRLMAIGIIIYIVWSVFNYIN